MIEDDRKQGFEPFLIVGTAGTTGAGVVDPLSDLRNVADPLAGCGKIDL